MTRAEGEQRMQPNTPLDASSESPDAQQPSAKPPASSSPPAPPKQSPKLPGLEPARGSLGAWVLLLVVVVASLAADLVSKSVAFARVADVPVQIERESVVALTSAGESIQRLIPLHNPRTVIPGLLEFQLVLNQGAVFGLGAGKRWVFVVFTLVAVGLGLWAFAYWTDARDRLAHVSIGLVLGGGIGNVFDRLVFACVRDFLHPLPGVLLPFGWTWPNDPSGQVWPWVSNIADLFLILGVLGLMVAMWRMPKPPATEAPVRQEPSA
ncbi:MAG: signal peptidase II [Planctomycetota bacterium]|nr:signal peptidase II [Planctomycetota bacterium]